MKKTIMNQIPSEIPQDIRRFFSGSDIYDSSCSREARVYFINKENGYYLKCSEHGKLKKEAEMTEYFYSKGLSAKVLNYISDEHDWLFSAAVVGDDCIHEDYLADPKRLCDTNFTKQSTLSVRFRTERQNTLPKQRRITAREIMIKRTFPTASDTAPRKRLMTFWKRGKTL